jgi:hypothetical protein
MFASASKPIPIREELSYPLSDAASKGEPAADKAVSKRYASLTPAFSNWISMTGSACLS